MKTILSLTIAVLLTGCANPNQFMKNFGDSMAAQSQARAAQATNQQPYQAVKTRQMDNQCFQGCTQAGYQYGLCQSKCSY